MNSKKILGLTLSIITSFALMVVSEDRLQAQTPAATFDELRSSLRLKAGDTIEVTEENGAKYKGKIAGFSNGTFTITRAGINRALAESQVRQIRTRHPDKWWNGMLIGAGVGAVASAIAVGTTCGSNDSECLAIATLVFVPVITGVGAGAGAAIDFGIRKDDTVFARPSASQTLRISPILDKQTVGARVVFKF